MPESERNLQIECKLHEMSMFSKHQLMIAWQL